MKKRNIFTLSTIVVLSLLFTACGGAKHDEHDHEHDATEEVVAANYACPMHPEETGKKGDRCSKCGMYLEEVKPEAPADSTSQEAE